MRNVMPPPRIRSNDPRDFLEEQNAAIDRRRGELFQQVDQVAARYEEIARAIGEFNTDQRLSPLENPTEAERKLLRLNDVAGLLERNGDLLAEAEQVLERLRSEAEAARLAARSPVEAELQTEVTTLRSEIRHARSQAHPTPQWAPPPKSASPPMLVPPKSPSGGLVPPVDGGTHRVSSVIGAASQDKPAALLGAPAAGSDRSLGPLQSAGGLTRINGGGVRKAKPHHH